MKILAMLLIGFISLQSSAALTCANLFNMPQRSYSLEDVAQKLIFEQNIVLGAFTKGYLNYYFFKHLGVEPKSEYFYIQAELGLRRVNFDELSKINDPWKVLANYSKADAETTTPNFKILFSEGNGDLRARFYFNLWLAIKQFYLIEDPQRIEQLSIDHGMNVRDFIARRSIVRDLEQDANILEKIEDILDIMLIDEKEYPQGNDPLKAAKTKLPLLFRANEEILELEKRRKSIPKQQQITDEKKGNLFEEPSEEKVIGSKYFFDESEVKSYLLDRNLLFGDIANYFWEIEISKEFQAEERSWFGNRIYIGVRTPKNGIGQVSQYEVDGPTPTVIAKLIKNGRRELLPYVTQLLRDFLLDVYHIGIENLDLLEKRRVELDLTEAEFKIRRDMIRRLENFPDAFDRWKSFVLIGLAYYSKYDNSYPSQGLRSTFTEHRNYVPISFFESGPNLEDFSDFYFKTIHDKDIKKRTKTFELSPDRNIQAQQSEALKKLIDSNVLFGEQTLHMWIEISRRNLEIMGTKFPVEQIDPFRSYQDWGRSTGKEVRHLLYSWAENHKDSVRELLVKPVWRYLRTFYFYGLNSSYGRNIIDELKVQINFSEMVEVIRILENDPNILDKLTPIITQGLLYAQEYFGKFDRLVNYFSKPNEADLQRHILSRFGSNLPSPTLLQPPIKTLPSTTTKKLPDLLDIIENLSENKETAETFGSDLADAISIYTSESMKLIEPLKKNRPLKDIFRTMDFSSIAEIKNFVIERKLEVKKLQHDLNQLLEKENILKEKVNLYVERAQGDPLLQGRFNEVVSPSRVLLEQYSHFLQQHRQQTEMELTSLDQINIIASGREIINSDSVDLLKQILQALEKN